MHVQRGTTVEIPDTREAMLALIYSLERVGGSALVAYAAMTEFAERLDAMRETGLFEPGAP